jgi:lipid-A-disaccharide synthase
VIRIFISAGEPSGDRLAADVARALGAREPGIALEGVGGDAMDAAGVRLLARSDGLHTLGLIEGARALPRHVRLLRDLGARLRDGEYRAAMLVDYPGFHLRLATRAARLGVPVLYYVAPQTWAWGEHRLHRLRRDVRQLAAILPFEVDYFARRGVTATFVGHPLLDRAAPPSRSEARRRLGISISLPAVALLPGSRPSEVQRHWPVFRAAAELLQRKSPGLEVIVASDLVPATLPEGFRRADCDARTALAAADGAIVKSGSSTLETALVGTPMVVAYRLHPLTYAVARRAVRIPRVALVNILAGREVVPELLQRAATPERLAAALEPLLDGRGAAACAQRAAFAELRGSLGTAGAARRVADLLLALAA